MFRIVSLFVLLMVGMSSFAQQKVTFSGVVRDAGSGETLIGALVALEKTELATSTNNYGFYSLSTQPGTYRAIVSYVGYESKVVELALTASKRMDIELRAVDNLLDEVVVSAKSEMEMSPTHKWAP